MADTLRSTTAICQQVMDLARGRVDLAEAYAYTTADTPVDFEANRLKSLETKESRGLALRVVKDGRIGLASTTRLDDLAGLVSIAVDLAAFGAEAKFDLPSMIAPTPVNVFDTAVESLRVEQMVEQGEEMIALIRAYDSAILCEAGVRRHLETTEIMNSRGGHGWYRKSNFWLIVGGQLIREGDFLSVWDYEARCGPDIDHRALAEATIRKFELAKNIVQVRSGRLPVVFSPRGVASILLGPFGAALSGRSVLQGSSALSDKLGQQAFDPRLSLTEDSTLSGVPGASPFDDEGMPTGRLPLIELGTVSNFYYDLQTAGLAGKQSTGNGYRSPESLPSPSTGVVLVEGGETPLEELLAGIQEGVLVESVTGNAGNVFSGDFSGNVQGGFKIENGKLAGRIKDTMIAGNIFTDMKALGGISRELEWVGGRVRAPHILFDSLGVATKGG